MEKLQRLLLILVVLTTSIFTALVPAGVSATSTYFNSKSSDGYISASSTSAVSGALSWAGSQSAATGTIDASSEAATVGVQGALLGGTYYTSIYRGDLIFDTSDLPDTAIISSASIQLYVYSLYTGQGATNFTLQAGTSSTYPHDPLEAGDYNATNYSGDSGSLSSASISTNQYNTWTLTTAGINAISLTSVTKYVLREKAHDIDNVVISYGAGTYVSTSLNYYTYEHGSSYYPILNVTYTLATAPTITANAASSITDTIATLNGTIDSDGGYPAGVAVKWGYGTTSQTAANFAAYDTVDGSFTGTYSTDDTPYKDVTSLTTGITYYYRFQAQNTAGTTTSEEMSFTTLAVPTVGTVAASAVSKTTARLNGSIPNSGGEACQVRWGYGTTSQEVADFELYDTVSALAGSYTNGSYPYLDISSLTADTLYYYRFQATNSIGTTTSGELTFTTSSGISEPSKVVGIPTSTSITLTWESGTGATQYLVRVGEGAFPTGTTDGTLVYFGTAVTVEIDGLIPGTTYYYSVWGESGGTYSASYETCMVTTQAGSTDINETGVALTAPWRWMSAPNYTNLSRLPVVYDAVNGVADALLMPRASFWMLLASFTSAIAGVLSYMGAGASGRGQQSQAIGMGVGLLVIVLWWLVQIMPWYIIGLYGLIMILTLRAKREMD